MATKVMYRVTRSDGWKSDDFDSPSDMCAFSRMLDWALDRNLSGEYVFELLYLGPQQEERLARVRRYSDRSLDITEVMI
jgi:hypothetical protein